MLNPKLKKLYTSEAIEAMEWMVTQLKPLGINPWVFGVVGEHKGVIAPAAFLWEGELDPEDLTLINISGEALRMVEKGWDPYENEYYNAFGVCYPKAAWYKITDEDLKYRLWV